MSKVKLVRLVPVYRIVEPIVLRLKVKRAKPQSLKLKVKKVKFIYYI